MDIFSSLADKLSGAGVELRANEPLSKHTSFRIGGPVRLMALPEDPEQAALCLRCAAEAGIEPVILGNGSNVLAPDWEFSAFVIKTTGIDDISADGDSIRAGGGALLSKTAAAARDASLTGMEFAHGIPGSVGGAVCMNAGAYGGEMKDIVRSVGALDMRGNERRFSADELDFGYRHSAFSSGGWLITQVVLELRPGDREKIKAEMDTLSAKRRGSQPLDMPSAGSTFKRPATGYAAALIDQAGLKGLRRGGAMVSEKHAGFVVNTGSAKCSDVLELMEEIERRVRERFGVELEPEVKILGGER